MAQTCAICESRGHITNNGLTIPIVKDIFSEKVVVIGILVGWMVAGLDKKGITHSRTPIMQAREII